MELGLVWTMRSRPGFSNNNMEEMSDMAAIEKVNVDKSKIPMTLYTFLANTMESLMMRSHNDVAHCNANTTDGLFIRMQLRR